MISPRWVWSQQCVDLRIARPVRHVREMEASVGHHFSGNRCVNCMCHSTENLYQYRTTSIIRAADDFYPRDDASQPAHLANGKPTALRPTFPTTRHASHL